MTPLYSIELLHLAKLALPWFGNDVNTILWDVDVRQLCAIARIESGDESGGWVETTRKQVEQSMIREKLGGLRRENSAA